MVLLILMAAVLSTVLSSIHSQSTRAAAPAKVIIPSMKLPWDKSLTTIPFKGGPFGKATDTTCALENTSIMSGVDFGLPQNTNVLAVAAGKVIYAGYTNNQIRNEVRIDHGGGFVTEYWGLNSIDPSIVPGVQVAQGQILGLSGYTPCPTCKNGISIHLRLEFRHYTSNPLINTPLSAHGMPIDGYKIWAFLNATSGRGYNFQGTMTRGMTIMKAQTECGVNGVKTWYSLNGPTVLAVANGTGGYLTSTNTTSQTQMDWPMFGFNAQHTRFNSSENRLNPTNVSNLALDWRYNTGASSQAVVVNGIVYTSSSGGNFVYALNATTRAYLWSYPLTSDSSPAIANGVVYIGSTDKKLYALNATTGAYLWSYVTGDSIYSSPTVANNVVYIGSFNHKLYALNATTGTYLWSYVTGSSIYSSPAVANGVVYVGSLDNTFYALNATSGAYLWSYATGAAIRGSPAVVNGVVYVGSYDRELYALNATTGTYLWSYVTGNSIFSSPAVANGVVYVGSEDDRLYALSATTGAYLWSYVTGNSIDSSPAVANGVVYVGSDDNSLYALNATTGAYLWSYGTGSYLFYSPVVSNGVVYIGSYDSYLYAFHLPGTTA